VRGLLATARRQDRDHLIHVTHVAEGVQRQLESLALKQQLALVGRLALVDRAELAEANEAEDRALALREREVLGSPQEHDLHRQSLNLGRPTLDRHELLTGGQLVARGHVVGDLR
jgi:hypothetical protein